MVKNWMVGELEGMELVVFSESLDNGRRAVGISGNTGCGSICSSCSTARLVAGSTPLHPDLTLRVTDELQRQQDPRNTFQRVIGEQSRS
jgi:hypothetical protein